VFDWGRPLVDLAAATPHPHLPCPHPK
jgi:hypothetical protein